MLHVETKEYIWNTEEWKNWKNAFLLTKSFITQEKSSQFNDFFSIKNASNLSCRKYGASYCPTFLMEINFLRRFSLKDFYEYTHRYFACVTRIFIRKTVLPIKLSCLICHFYTFPSNTHWRWPWFLFFPQTLPTETALKFIHTHRKRSKKKIAFVLNGNYHASYPTEHNSGWTICSSCDFSCSPITARPFRLDRDSREQ